MQPDATLILYLAEAELEQQHPPKVPIAGSNPACESCCKRPVTQGTL